MGLFRKESKTHFERDEEGRVVNVSRTGDVERETKEEAWHKPTRPERQYEREMVQEYRKKKPSRLSTMFQEGKTRRINERTIYKQTYAKAREAQVRAKAKQRAKQDVMQPFGRFTGTSSGGYSTRKNYNPFGSVFDTGMKPMSMPKTTHKKKTTARKKTPFGFDLTDNWGFMK